jgi:hypothetical protein
MGNEAVRRVRSWRPAPFADLPLAVRTVAIVLAVIACASVAPRGGAIAASFVLASAACIAYLAAAVATPRDRIRLIAVALLAVLARDILVGAFDTLMYVRTGALTYAPDEITYLQTALMQVRHWRDPSAPFDAGDFYLLSWYVQMMAGIFYVFGENLVVVKVVNTLLAAAAALLVYRTMLNLRLPGAFWAAAVVLWFPSISFWSALALKDAYVIFFLMLSLWTSSEFVRTRKPAWLVATVLAMYPIYSVRNYIFVVDAVAWIAVAAAVSPWRTRVLTFVGVTATVFALFVILQPFAGLGVNPFYIPVLVRNVNAAYASSAYAEPTPVIAGVPGQRFVVVVPGVTTAPDFSPNVVMVSPGGQIVIEQPGRTVAPLTSNQASVRPGDIVEIAGPSPTASLSPASPTPAPSPARSEPPPTASPSPPQPTARPSPSAVLIQPELRNTVGLSSENVDVSNSAGGSIAANLRALPKGLLFALFAPFPWSPPNNLEQAATIPEMLLWYVLLALAAVGVVTLLRRRDLAYAHGLAAAVGLLLVLALIEASTGTLVRSRGMLVPYVLILSAVGFETIRAWRARRALAAEGQS